MGIDRRFRRGRLATAAFVGGSCLFLTALAAQAAPLQNVTSIAASGDSDGDACALLPSGGVMCWGSNDHEQLGDAAPSVQPGPIDVPGLATGVQSIAVGGGGYGEYVCALTTAGGVKCMGSNHYGQLGDGTTVDRPTPVDVSGLTSGVVAIAPGSDHACALTSAGGVKCWGRNDSGDLGDGTTVQRHTPVDVVGLTSGVVAISQSCAVTATGGVKCWGNNVSKQLGNGSSALMSAIPVDVSGLASGVIAVSAAGSRACALTSGGGVKCWGHDEGLLGTGSSSALYSSTPVDVAGLSTGVAAISVGYGGTCVLMIGGGVKCWGSRTGDGTMTVRDAPVDVVGLPGPAISVAKGQYFTCALLATGEVMCWGINLEGELGVGQADNLEHVSPETVVVLAPQSISFGALGAHDVNEPPFTIGANASSGMPVAFSSAHAWQWQTTACSVSGTTVTLLANGICSIAADQAGDMNYYPARQVVRSFLVTGSSPSATPRLANLSTRGEVTGGDGVMIGGIVVQGPVPKQVVVRALGPSLAAYGVGNPLANPQVRLVRLSDQFPMGSNDDWEAGGYGPILQDIGLAPSDSSESALLTILDPGVYTAVVTGVGGSTGVALVEVYEIDRPFVPLINVSTRGNVGSGGNAMIGGFVIQGSTPQTVVVRGIGPSLAAYGIAGTLSNPTLQLVRMSDSATIATNDDWGSAPNVADLTATGFAPSDPSESAILITLDPGAYTAIVSGAGGATGVGMVEVYAVQ